MTGDCPTLLVVETFPAEIILYLDRYAPTEILTDQYGAARVALFDLAAVPELEAGREPGSQLLLYIFPFEGFFVDFRLVKAQDIRLLLSQELCQVARLKRRTIPLTFQQ